MTSLSLRNSVTPSLTGVIIATALGSFSLNSHASSSIHPNTHDIINKMEQVSSISTPGTFSSVDVKSSYLNDNLDNMIVELFEKISRDAKPLDADFSQLLSENFADLF